MKLNPISLKKTLNKAYLKEKVIRSDIEQFKANLIALLDRINEEESEENAKGHLTAFLKDTYYKDRHLIATKGRTDLVIHEETKASSPAGVLFEVKRPRNQADMITAQNANTRALHELVLYYLQERIEGKNTDIKYCIVTNIYEWYVFDAAVFDKTFYQNRPLRRDYEHWRDGRKTQSTTDFFYRDIARPFLDKLEEALPCTYFNLKDYERPLRNQDPTDDKKLAPLFKALSPTHLLKLPFANDSNSLDKRFYNELLHIIGLEETKEKSKKIIGRQSEDTRQPGSLLEKPHESLLGGFLRGAGIQGGSAAGHPWRKTRPQSSADEIAGASVCAEGSGRVPALLSVVCGICAKI